MFLLGTWVFLQVFSRILQVLLVYLMFFLVPWSSFRQPPDWFRFLKVLDGSPRFISVSSWKLQVPSGSSDFLLGTSMVLQIPPCDSGFLNLQMPPFSLPAHQLAKSEGGFSESDQSAESNQPISRG